MSQSEAAIESTFIQIVKKDAPNAPCFVSVGEEEIAITLVFELGVELAAMGVEGVLGCLMPVLSIFENRIVWG